MARIEIFVEEPSMKAFLITLLPKIIKHPWTLDENYFIRSFEGKSDLQKNIPKKMEVFNNWHEPVGIIILQDQDSNDCIQLKQKLLGICEEFDNCRKMIRIVCRELESWYLGDMKAIAAAFPDFKYQKYINKTKFRNPDLCNGYDEIRKIVVGFQKVSGAKLIAPHINIEENTSESFQQTIRGFRLFFNQF